MWKLKGGGHLAKSNAARGVRIWKVDNIWIVGLAHDVARRLIESYLVCQRKLRTHPCRRHDALLILQAAAGAIKL